MGGVGEPVKWAGQKKKKMQVASLLEEGADLLPQQERTEGSGDGTDPEAALNAPDTATPKHETTQTTTESASRSPVTGQDYVRGNGTPRAPRRHTEGETLWHFLHPRLSAATCRSLNYSGVLYN